jgi:AcrR family transcriptional regulator
MTSRNGSSPRKQPRQGRAKVTVEALLEAAAQVLVSSGYEATTTKQVAERAGVSIGSLYQYFPNKEALVSALFERISQQVLTVLSDSLRPAEVAEPQERVRRLVRTLVEVYAVNPRLQQVLLEQAPRMGPQRSVQELQFRLESLVRSALSRNAERLRPRNLELAVFLLLRAVRGAIWSTLTERPELVREPEFVEELSALVLGYLKPGT